MRESRPQLRSSEAICRTVVLHTASPIAWSKPLRAPSPCSWLPWRPAALDPLRGLAAPPASAFLRVPKSADRSAQSSANRPSSIRLQHGKGAGGQVCRGGPDRRQGEPGQGKDEGACPPAVGRCQRQQPGKRLHAGSHGGRFCCVHRRSRQVDDHTRPQLQVAQQPPMLRMLFRLCHPDRRQDVCNGWVAGAGVLCGNDPQGLQTAGRRPAGLAVSMLQRGGGAG